MKNFNASSVEAASKEARIERFNTNCLNVVSEFKNLQKLINTFLEIEYSEANIDLMKVRLVEFNNQTGRFLASAKEVLTVIEEIRKVGEYTEDIKQTRALVSLLNIQILAILAFAGDFIKQSNKKSLTGIKRIAKTMNDISDAA